MLVMLMLFMLHLLVAGCCIRTLSAVTVAIFHVGFTIPSRVIVTEQSIDQIIRYLLLYLHPPPKKKKKKKEEKRRDLHEPKCQNLRGLIHKHLFPPDFQTDRTLSLIHSIFVVSDVFK